MKMAAERAASIFLVCSTLIYPNEKKCQIKKLITTQIWLAKMAKAQIEKIIFGILHFESGLGAGNEERGYLTPLKGYRMKFGLR